RRRTEIGHKAFVFAHIATVHVAGDVRQLVYNMAPGVFRLRRWQQVRFEDRAGIEGQTADGDIRQTVLKADHLALFSYTQTAFQAAWRLREQRRVCRCAATTDRAATSVEQ